MGSLSFTQFLALPRGHSSWPYYTSVSIVKVQDIRCPNQWVLKAASRKNASESSGHETAGEGVVKKNDVSAKQPLKRGRRKFVAPVNSDVAIDLVLDSDDLLEEGTNKATCKKDVKKTRGRPRSKGTPIQPLVWLTSSSHGLYTFCWTPDHPSHV